MVWDGVKPSTVGFLTFLCEEKPLARKGLPRSKFFLATLCVGCRITSFFIVKLMIRKTVKTCSQPLKSIDAIKSVVIGTKTFLKADSQLILVCGKQPNPQSPGARDHILKYAKIHLKKFQFFIAEKVFESISNPDIDLLSLEENLLDYCDCVLVILESESTFAELGAFAIKNELVKNMLVINDIKFKDNKSFISLGPLAKIEKVSYFKPVIHVSLCSILRAMPELLDRLERIERHNQKKIDINSAEKFNALPPKIRMLFLLDLITIFQPVMYGEIVSILKYIYGEQEYDISLCFHLLNALELTSRINKYYVRKQNDPQLFFAYKGLQELNIRADVINHYHKYSREKVSVIKNKINGYS